MGKSGRFFAPPSQQLVISLGGALRAHSAARNPTSDAVKHACKCASALSIAQDFSGFSNTGNRINEQRIKQSECFDLPPASQDASALASLIASLISLVQIASAATVWNESTNGDLSNDRTAPTSVNLAIGSNDVHRLGAGISERYRLSHHRRARG